MPYVVATHLFPLVQNSFSLLALLPRRGVVPGDSSPTFFFSNFRTHRVRVGCASETFEGQKTIHTRFCRSSPCLNINSVLPVKRVGVSAVHHLVLLFHSCM